MPTESKSEPTVSVHGLPKSQYEAGGSVPAAGGGGGFDKKWILWIGLGIVGIIVVFMLFGGGFGSSTPPNPSTGSGSDNANVDAELQKLQSEIDQLLGNQNKQNPNPKPKKKDHDDARTGGLPFSPDTFSHAYDVHGFLPHQRLG